MAPVFMPNDGERLRRIKVNLISVILENQFLLKSLINHEWTDRIVIGQDIHTAHRLLMKGGHGFGHLLRVVKGVKHSF